MVEKAFSEKFGFYPFHPFSSALLCVWVLCLHVCLYRVFTVPVEAKKGQNPRNWSYRC